MRLVLLYIILALFIVSANAQELKLILPLGHQGDVNSCVYSPDGKYMVTASDDRTAKVWEVLSGNLIFDLKGHGSYVTFATFSPDQKNILTACYDGVVRIWNFLNGELIRELSVGANVNSAKYSPDGKYIVTAANDKKVKIFEAASGKLIRSLPASTFWVHCAMYSPDGKYILTAGSLDNACQIWNSSDGKLIRVLKGHTSFIHSAVYSNDGKYIITASEDKTARLWNANDGKLIRVLKHHTASLYSAIFSPDSKKIVTTSEDDTMRELDIKDGRIIYTVDGEFKYATYSPDGKYLAATYYLRVEILKLDNGLLDKELTGHSSFFNSVSYSPDGKYILTSSLDFFGGRVKIWDAANGNFITEFSGDSSMITNAIYSPDGMYILTTSDGFIKIRDASTGNIIIQWLGHGQDEYHNSRINSAVYSPDGKYILTASGTDNSAKIWDANNGKLLKKLSEKWKVNTAQYSPDGKYIVLTTWDTAKIYSSDGKFIRRLTGNDVGINWAGFTPDGKSIITNNGNIWNVADGKFLRTLKGDREFIVSASYSRDGKYLVATSSDRKVRIWDAKTDDMVQQLEGHYLNVTSVCYSPDGKKIITVSYDNTYRVWDAAKGVEQYSLCALDSIDNLKLLPSGYYMSTQNAAKLLHYVKGHQAISFEQLDIKYNRPDLVLKAIGNNDTLLTNAYAKAYLKRIKKLGVDTSSFLTGYAIPEADFVDRDRINSETNSTDLYLHIKAEDSISHLDKFNIWVNEVPMFGIKGISIRQRNSNIFDSTFRIKLSEGDNKIETSVVNNNGIESYKSPLFVKCTPLWQVQKKIHFIGIGINQFLNPSYNLQWSVKDIHDLTLKLKEKYGSNITIDTLFDDKVTRENVLALKQKLLSLSEDDEVIISYSGHGVLNKEYDYFLSTYAINFDEPEKQGLPYDDLESLVDGIKPRKKLLLIDACHSGELDKDEIAHIETVTKQLDSTGITHKSSIKITPKKNIGMANSFELMQSLFVNVGKGTGATIISAAGGMQYAQERGDLKNGVFTYSILEAFNQHDELKVSELKRIVGERVSELTHGLQKPTFRNETNNFDWRVW